MTDTQPTPTTNNNARFDAEAAGWDSNPFVQSATKAGYQALKSTLPILQSNSNANPNSKPSVLEIGCGTGLLSLLMSPDVKEITSIDASPGMIRVLESKLSKPDCPAKNIQAICVLLEDPEDPALPPSDPNSSETSKSTPRKKYDLITSHLVLHHIEHLPPVLKTMYGCLKSGGEIALTDFEDFGPEAKKFHPQSKMKGVERHGINRAWIEGLIREAGFVDVDVSVGWRMEKEVERWEGEFGSKAEGGDGQGEMMEFPFLICRGLKA